MPVYTVHAPTANGADFHAADGFIFVRDGFHLWAAILGVVWLAWHRLWIAMIGWTLLMAAIDIAMVQFRVGSTAIILVDGLLALLLGFEASSLRRWTFSRRNWRQLDIVVADDLEAAERRFFERWGTRLRGSTSSQPPVDRGAPPPVRDSRGQPFPNPPPLPAGGIIGLFPEPGGHR
jgi:Protein of unknown function (DUF2628)